MDDTVRQALADLVHREGVALTDDPRRCIALLKDHCPGHKREVNVLRAALEHDVVAGLRHSDGVAPLDLTLARLTSGLVEDGGLAEEPARWAVAAWAIALGFAPAVGRQQGGANVRGATGGGTRSVASVADVDAGRPAPSIVNPRDGSLLVYVPAGEFEMGDGQDSDCPRHRVYLDAYYIGIHCVTNAQYAKFVTETGYRRPDNREWQATARAQHPVTDVAWEDARAYATWAGLRLPTEAEWEKAARGPANSLYPWGDEWSAHRCRHGGNRGNQTTAPVTDYESGVSGYGTYQQSGNVWEWCLDWYDGNYYHTSPRENPSGPATGSSRVFRGGSWASVVPAIFRGAYRCRYAPSRRNDFLGFRLVRAAAVLAPP